MRSVVAAVVVLAGAAELCAIAALAGLVTWRPVLALAGAGAIVAITGSIANDALELRAELGRRLDIRPRLELTATDRAEIAARRRVYLSATVVLVVLFLAATTPAR